MKKHIAEELPARKFPQAAAGGKDAGDKEDKKGGKTPEERIRQAVYDIRYRARREEIPLTQAFSQYMQNSSMSQVEKTAVKKKLAGKDGTMKEDYNIEEFASDNVVVAYHKVFVEGVSLKEEDVVSAEELYFEEIGKVADRKYKVRVTGTDGRSYVRYATREKINQLRANPNIESVEMTEYGEPYEGEKKKGEQTAAAKRGDKLDPVGHEDSDIDNDGKENTPRDKYLKNRREVRGAAIASRGTQKEEFLGEVKKIKKNKEDKKFDVMKGSNKVVTMPPESKSIGEEVQLDEKTLTGAEKAKKEEIVKSLKKKYGKTAKTYAIATSVAKRVAEAAECGCEDDEPKLKKSEGSVDDPRAIPTKINMIKNKMRAMGLKMSYEPEGEQIDEVLGGQSGDGYIGHPRLGIKNPLAKKQTTTNTAPKNTGIAGKLGNRASEMEKMMNQMNSYEVEGEVVSEEESDRESDRAREAGDWRSRSQRPVRRRPSVSDDPRYGSMSDDEWSRSSHNPANKQRPRRRYYR